MGIELVVRVIADVSMAVFVRAIVVVIMVVDVLVVVRAGLFVVVSVVVIIWYTVNSRTLVFISNRFPVHIVVIPDEHPHHHFLRI